MRDFHLFQNRTIISATLVMETPLSVGSRLSLLPAGSDLPVMKTPEGVPFIPGSSLKGVIRTHTERLLRTLDAVGRKWRRERLWACNPLSEQERCVVGTCCDQCEDCKGNNCCPNCERCKACMVKRNQKNGRLDDKPFTAELWEKSCTACRLFGSPWLASRMHFQDTLLANKDDLLHWTEVRDGVGIDRDLGAAKHGIKYDYEVVSAGARFVTRIVVENAEGWEVGLLLLSLKAMEQGELLVGGKTTRGLGWGRLEDLTVERITAANLLDYLQGQSAPRVDPQEFIQTFVDGLQ
jgi:CRISPR-associated RAMP protein (TIGR02581 family)